MLAQQIFDEAAWTQVVPEYSPAGYIRLKAEGEITACLMGT